MRPARSIDPPAAIHDLTALVALFADPAVAARQACDLRATAFHNLIWVRPAPAPAPATTTVLRGDTYLEPPGLALVHVPSNMSLAPASVHVPSHTSLEHVPSHMSPAPASAHVPSHTSLEHVPSDMSPAWPDPRQLRAGDRLILRVEQWQLTAYCAWLLSAATAPGGWTVTPFCPQPGGLFRLHLIAAARLALPTSVRIEVRHDLHGVRLAQVALGFGADTFAGPIDAGRHLPLAGVPRPSETSAAALCELVRQAGLEPTTDLPETTP